MSPGDYIRIPFGASCTRIARVVAVHPTKEAVKCRAFNGVKRMAHKPKLVPIESVIDDRLPLSQIPKWILQHEA